MTRRTGDDWRDACGHELLVAETFVDPSRFSGGMYRAAGWKMPGLTKGFARSNGRCTEPHGVPKELHFTPLRRDARRRLRTPDPLPRSLQPDPMDGRTELPPGRLRSLREDPMRVADFRRAQGRRHAIAFVIAVIIAARLTGITSGIGAARFARALTRRQLAAPGAWRHPGTGRYMPPSRSVTCRVLESVGPTEIEAALKRRSVPRLGIGAAIAADGKRIRGANRFGDGRHETATPVARDNGLPVACRGFNDAGGEGAAVRALPGRSPLPDGSSPSMRCTRRGTPPAASSRPTGPTI